MGRWLFMRAVLGPQSGYTSTWCEVPHWGLVLSGDMTINYREDTELVSAGDAFYAPAGHRFESSDGATIIDYTPLSELDPSRGLPAWRKRVVDQLVRRAPAGVLESRGREVIPPVAEPRSIRGGSNARRRMQAFGV